MAAILIDRPLSARAEFPAVRAFSTSCVNRRDPIDWSATLRSTWSATCEVLFLLWMLAVVAFSLLIAAGATGFLG